LVEGLSGKKIVFCLVVKLHYTQKEGNVIGIQGVGVSTMFLAGAWLVIEFLQASKENGMAVGSL